MDPRDWARETAAALDVAAGAAGRFLAALDAAPVRAPGAESAAARFGGPLPDAGAGATGALTELVQQGLDGALRSTGPRYFHFVQGGATPAALGADWLTAALDQNALGWAGSPLATRLEVVALGWLKELFALPATWGGILTTGATTANLTALAAARHWWAARHGVDVEAQGLSGLPPVPVFAGGYVHPSALKALAMLGIGRGRVRVLARDAAGRLDLAALEGALRGLDGAPAILLATAGDVNTGDFDPIEAMADLAQRYGAWLHVDGAFGLFARVAPAAATLAAGVERAQSVIADGHKWLNVPYDCGFAFVHDPALLGAAFGSGQDAPYLPAQDDPRPSFLYLGPEMSRRARALAVWATLRAYGRSGYRALVEHHLGLAQRLARRVDGAPDLERLAPVALNIVCFRYRPPGVPADALDDLNTRLGRALLEDGRVYAGTTRYAGNVALRPAIVNWRTGPADVDLLVDTVRELGARC